MKYLKSNSEYNENQSKSTFSRNPMSLYSITYEEDLRLLSGALLDVKDILLELEDYGFETLVSNRTWSQVADKPSGVIQDRSKFYKCYSMVIDIKKYDHLFDINDIKETLFRLENYFKINLPGFRIEYVDHVDKRIKEREIFSNIFTHEELMVRIVKIVVDKENSEYN